MTGGKTPENRRRAEYELRAGIQTIKGLATRRFTNFGGINTFLTGDDYIRGKLTDEDYDKGALKLLLEGQVGKSIKAATDRRTKYGDSTTTRLSPLSRGLILKILLLRIYSILKVHQLYLDFSSSTRWIQRLSKTLCTPLTRLMPRWLTMMQSEKREPRDKKLQYLRKSGLGIG